MRPNSGLTGPACALRSEATRWRNDRRGRALIMHIRGPLAPPIGALMQHEEARETPRPGVRPGERGARQLNAECMAAQ